MSARMKETVRDLWELASLGVFLTMIGLAAHAMGA